MDYMTSAEAAKKWNISQRRVAVYCKEGRINGAALRGRMWMIPSDAKKPEDPRRTRDRCREIRRSCNGDGYGDSRV